MLDLLALSMLTTLCPQSSEDATAVAQAPPATVLPAESHDAPLPADFVEVLEGVRALGAGSEPDAAQERVGELLSTTAWAKLLAADAPVRRAGITALDDASEGLGSRALQGAIRSAIAEGLANVPDADGEELATALWKLGSTHYLVRNLEGARDAWTRVKEIRERTLNADHPDLLSAMAGLAVVRLELGDLAGAKELSERVHDARERVGPDDDPLLMNAKQNLAIVLKEVGELDRALALELEVIEVRERTLGERHPEALKAQQHLAITMKKLGDFEGALDLEEAILAERSRTLPEGHPERIRTRQNLAMTRMRLGDLQEALLLGEGTHALLERILPDNHPALLRSHQFVGALLRILGDHERAVAFLEAAYLGHANSWPEDHPHVLSAKSSLAIARFELGDVSGARELFAEVLEVRERVLPSGHADLVTIKNSTASCLWQMGEFERSRALFEEVFESAEQRWPPEHPLVLHTKQNLAAALADLGYLDQALELQEAVVSARERSLPEDHPDLLAALTNLSRTLRRKGDFDEALSLGRRVVAAHEQSLPEGHSTRLTSEASLIETYVDAGMLESALAATKLLLKAQLSRAESLHLLAPRVARSAALIELQRLRQLPLFGRELPDDTHDSLVHLLFSVVESLRSASTSSSRVTSLARKNAALGSLLQQATRIRHRLNDLGSDLPEEAEQTAAWRRELLLLTEDRDSVERELRRELISTGFEEEPITVARVAERLEADAVLVSFLRYEPRSESAVAPETRSDELLALTVRPDGAVTKTELGAAAELETLAHEWRARLGRPIAARGERATRGIGVAPEQDPGSAQEEEEEIGAALRERLLDPLLSTLGDDPPAIVYLVLDDFLHLLPIDALPWKEGERIGDAFDLRVETSVDRLVSPPRAIGKGSLLALGGVDFDALGVENSQISEIVFAAPPVRGAATSERSAVGSLKPLPHSQTEAESLGELYRELSGREPVVLTGKHATKAALHELAPRARYLHVATHGWFAAEAFESMIDSTDNSLERDVFARAEQTLRGFAPETLCGLALAGANGGANEIGKVPGIMSAEELATLDLSQCELAVLSACETNVGIRRAGQGIQSLQTALHTAGARTAITSLWTVDDAATRQLMESFYGNLWSAGVGKAEALWRAKRALRDADHPIRDWAGWVLTGDPD